MAQRIPQPGVIPLPQAINKYFELSLYLLVLMGFGTLASTGGLDLATVLLVGAALAFRGYLLAERRRVVISERWTTPLTIAYFVFYAADYFLLSRAFLAATVHLVLFAVVVRTFSLRRDRDYTTLARVDAATARAALPSCAALRGAHRHGGATVPVLPPNNAADAQRNRRHRRHRRHWRQRQMGRLRGRAARRSDVHGRHSGIHRRRRGLRRKTGRDFRGRQSQNARVFLQMPFGVYRRTDALVITGLERIDDPCVEMHFIGGFLRAHPAPLPLGLEPLSERLRELAHRLTPLRIC